MAKILLAEDDLFIRDIYSEVLNDEKYEVELAKDGSETLQKIKQGNWDIVLLDVMMPKMTGIEVLKELKKENNLTFAKHVILMTNTEEAKELNEINDMYDGYILKSSITPGELIEKVKEYLSK